MSETKLDEALIETIYNEFIEPTRTLPKCNPESEDVMGFVRLVYKEECIPVPPIVICGSPTDACERASKELGKKVTSLGPYGIGDGGWVANRVYGIRAGLLNDPDIQEEVKGCLALAAWTKVCWGAIWLDTVCLIVPYPTTLQVDTDGNYHSETGPAVSWPDGKLTEYAWHGTFVPQLVIEHPEQVTKQMIADETNTEVRRAICERIGWDKAIELLGAIATSKFIHDKTGLSYELLVAGNEKWIKKQSPKLKNGTQPYFVEPVHANLKTAAGARRWQAPPFVSPEEADRDPILEYEIET
jgi:hypothetical protein